MKSQKHGKIINVASNVVHKGLPYLLHYVASKGAVMAMTRALARELGPFGITVNAIAPGYVLHEATARSDQGRNHQVIALRALGRDRKSTRLNSSHVAISYAVFCLKKKNDALDEFIRVNAEIGNETPFVVTAAPFAL